MMDGKHIVKLYNAFYIRFVIRSKELNKVNGTGCCEQNSAGASEGIEVDGGRAVTEPFPGMDGLIHISAAYRSAGADASFQSAGLKWAGKLSVAKLSVMRKESAAAAAANTQLQ